MLFHINFSIDAKNDMKRLWILQNKLFWVPYEQFEFTRLQQVRGVMDEHIMYNKEELLFKNQNQKEGEVKKEDKFIWSYVLRPVRRNNAFK